MSSISPFTEYMEYSVVIRKSTIFHKTRCCFQVSKKESESHWQQNDYKIFNPTINWDTVDYSSSPAIQEYPIQSAICEPPAGSVLDDSEEVTLKGYVV